MPYNILAAPIAPFALRSGAQKWLSVSELTMDLADGDYALEPAWPRPDFNVATYELLIGLVSVAMAPARDAEWRARWKSPPSAEQIEAALAPLRPAFNLDGEGPRFLQEFGGLSGEANPIEALLIDTPGENGQKKNADLLTHRYRYPALSLPAAAIALYALQAFAPSGGAGNRTSMRGGGPLTALVIPQSEHPAPPVSLWHKLWANVALRPEPLPALERIFPWLRPTQSSGKDDGAGKVHESDPSVHSLHAFFGMPRRLWLTFADDNAICAMTGASGPAVTGFVQKPYGFNYGLWQHPLIPYRREKEAGEPYSAKPKGGRFGYRDWVAATLGDGKPEPLRQPAANVDLARRDRGKTLTQDWHQHDARIRVAGWAMNNMEAISYLSAETPLHLARERDDMVRIDKLARQMAEAGDIANAALRQDVKGALFSEASKPKDDRGILDAVRSDFYVRTDDDFHALLEDVAARTPSAEERDGTSRKWLRALRDTALDLFDEAAPVPVDDAEKAVQVVRARANLRSSFFGYGGMGGKLFGTLDLLVPEKRKVKEGAQ